MVTILESTAPDSPYGFPIFTQRPVRLGAGLIDSIDKQIQIHGQALMMFRCFAAILTARVTVSIAKSELIALFIGKDDQICHHADKAALGFS